MEIDKRTKVEYNNIGKKERQFLNNEIQRNRSGIASEKESNSESNSKINKNSIPTQQSNRERSSSVVFEHIVPNAVKKMWVMAEASNLSSNKEEPLQSGNRLTSKYGNFFISHDAAKENKESNAEVLKKYKSESVSESPELPNAKSHWGVQLKPVSRDSELVSNSKSERPRSVVLEDNITNNHKNLKFENRAQSLDFLDKVDGDKRESSTQLSVQQRKKNFENSLITSENENEQSDKYAILHTKRPLKSSIGDFDLRGKSRIFYQPSKNQIINGDNSEKKNARKQVSLKDLLKQDEASLGVDVVNSKDRKYSDTNNNKLQIDKTENIKDRITTTVVDNNPVDIKDEIDVIKNGKVNLDEHEAYNKIDDSSSSLKTLNKLNFTIVNSKPVKKESAEIEKVKKNVEIYTNSNLIPKQQVVGYDKKEKSKKEIEISTNHKDENISIKKKNKPNFIISNDENVKGFSSNKQENEKITDKKKDTNISPTKDEVQKYNNKNKLEHFSQTDKNIMIETESTSPIEKQQVKHISNEKPNQIDKQLINPIIKQDVKSVKKEASNDKQVKNDTETKSLSQIGNLVSKSDTETTKPIKQKQVNHLKEHISNGQTSQNTNKQPSTQTSKDNQGIRRKVGKLIIMTGEQRDQQLKEIEKIKNGQTPAGVKLEPKISGLALTFMSNEVADDDEPLPPVPTIIFNNPLPKLKSIIATKSKKKKTNVSFRQGKLATIHSYPSESSYLDEVDSSGQLHKTEDAVHRERDRLANEAEPKVEVMQNINFVTEGGDFNSYSNEESGSALLF